MRYKLAILLIMTGIFFAGCIESKEVLKNDTSETVRTIKYIENYDTILVKDDFADFSLIDHKYFVTPENLTLTLKIESYHGANTIDVNKINKSIDKREIIPTGFRLYGGSELYRSNNSVEDMKGPKNKYMLIQYKVFDNDEDLNQSMNETVYGYVQNGFRNTRLNDTNYKERIFVLESNVNNSNTNVTVILLGYDTVLGKIGVQDSKNESLNKSLRIIDLLLERLKVGSKDITINKTKIISEMADFNITQKRAPVEDY